MRTCVLIYSRTRGEVGAEGASSEAVTHVRFERRSPLTAVFLFHHTRKKSDMRPTALKEKLLQRDGDERRLQRSNPASKRSRHDEPCFNCAPATSSHCMKIKRLEGPALGRCPLALLRAGSGVQFLLEGSELSVHRLFVLFPHPKAT